MGKGQLLGILGNVWIRHVPQPDSTIDLAGPWTLCKDDLFHDTGTVTLPSHFESKSVWRTISVPKEKEGKNVMLMLDGDYPFDAVVNGTLLKYGDVPKPNSRVGLTSRPSFTLARITASSSSAFTATPLPLGSLSISLIPQPIRRPPEFA